MSRNGVEARTGRRRGGEGETARNDAIDLKNVILICIFFSSEAKFNPPLTSRNSAGTDYLI